MFVYKRNNETSIGGVLIGSRLEYRSMGGVKKGVGPTILL